MEKVRAALIGCGGRNGAHYQKLTSFADVELVGFCDLHIDRAQRMSDGCGQGRVYEKYEEMLDAEKPDVVFIAVEPCAHGALEQAVLARNIPFMIEKPMTLDLKEAENVRDQIKAKGLICAVGFQDRYQNLTQIMKDYIKDKKVGLVSGGWMGGIPGVWWWRKMETSGGQIVEQNIHLFDQLRFLFGEPETVFCAAGKGIVDESYNMPGYNVDDYSSATIKFKNGVVANLFTSDYHVGGSHTDSGMTVYCKDATLHYSLRSTLRIHDKDGWHEPIQRGEEQTGIMDRIYIDAIKTGDASKVLSTYEDAVESLRLTLACNESIRTGQAIKLN
jgi:myo-inositol 2-dehydrogenase/D-chiro-inositol 1-dehydrogenase